MISLSIDIYMKNTVQSSYNLNGTFVCSHVNACVCMSHTLLHAYPIILFLQTYSHNPLTLCFHTPSHGYLHMLNNAGTRGEYSDNNLSYAPRIKWLNNQKNTGLHERNSFITCQGTPRTFFNAKKRQ